MRSICNHLSWIVIFLSSCTEQQSLIVSAPPLTFSPHLCDSSEELTIYSLLWEGLFPLEEAPGIAQGYTLSPDGKSLEILLGDSYWSDGSLVEANDFIYAWRRILSSKETFPHEHLLYQIENATEIKKGQLPTSMLGAIAIETKRLLITLEAPSETFLEDLSLPIFYPMKAYSEVTLYNGPFILSKRDANTTLHRNPHYRGVVFMNEITITEDDLSHCILPHSPGIPNRSFHITPSPSLSPSDLALIEKGLSPGFPLKLLFEESDNLRDIAKMISSTWSASGVELSISPINTPSLSDYLDIGDHYLLLSEGSGGISPYLHYLTISDRVKGITISGNGIVNLRRVYILP